MPLSAHYGGKGAKVMKSMVGTYGAKKAKRVFYATENKRKSNMPMGVAQSPKGDIGMHRQMEARMAGGFHATMMAASSHFTKGR